MATPATSNGVETKVLGAAKETYLEVQPISLYKCTIHVEGDSMLVTHPFSEKARATMLEGMRGGIRKKKEPKDPDREYEASKYLMNDGTGRCGMRSIAFKAAVVDAATQLDKSVTKVFLRGVFHIPGELVAIDGTPERREDVCRVGLGTADLRYRAMFWPWRCSIPIVYNARNINIKSLVELFNMAGFACGVGEYRPQRDGSWGCYHVIGADDEGRANYPLGSSDGHIITQHDGTRSNE